MKHTDMMHSNSTTVRYIAPKKVNKKLTETDILSLQDAFLTTGFHSIEFTDQAAGRNLIKNFLHSLPTYRSIACLTLDNGLDLPNTVFDLYASLYNDGLSEQAIEEFFINDFYYDFMWIEISATLLSEPWYKHFCKIMAQYEKQMPIVKVFYA